MIKLGIERVSAFFSSAFETLEDLEEDGGDYCFIDVFDFSFWYVHRSKERRLTTHTEERIGEERRNRDSRRQNTEEKNN